MNPVEARRLRIRRIWILAAISVAALAVSILFGRYPGPAVTPFSVIENDALARDLILHIRLPRIAAAFLLGAALSAAGAVFQTVFRNPLVDAGFLGVSQGAAFGASAAIVFAAGNAWAVQGGAALFAFLGLALSYALASRIRLGDKILHLVLAGIVVGAFYAAGTGIMKYIADPQKQLPDITYWMLGGLWGITGRDVMEMMPVIAVGLAYMMATRWRLNLLAMKDETAFSLGAAPGRERLGVLIAAVAVTAIGVAKAGQIAWVGLIVPHICRRLVGSETRVLLPASVLLGGIFVLVCDDLARVALSGEIPLGILTSLLGTVLFLILLLQRKIRGIG
ncbi:MAG: iron ABC transporter permease [Candidatus Aminicenantes bacterium]|nr:iron ABC transporter permease [Candidatus Aminicenantes bacterium]